MHDRDIEFPQMLCGSDAGEEKDLWRTKSAATHEDFAIGPDHVLRPIACGRDLDADRFGRGASLFQSEEHPLGVNGYCDGEVRSFTDFAIQI